MKIFKTIIATSLVATSLLALEPMAKESGFSGMILIGAGGIKYKSNEVAGNRMIDVEDKTINDYSSPSSQSTAFPLFTGNAKYTLEDRKTEFFIGNALEDFLRMDSSLAIGVRHSFDDVGIIGVRLLASVAPTDVWEDPFLTGTARSGTERTSAGIGLKWENIFGSNFEIDIRSRGIDFDDDRNGKSKVVDSTITSAEQRELERDGVMGSTEILYTFDLDKSNFLIPSIKFTGNDRDGDANDYARTDLKISYIHISKDWIIAANASIGASSYDDNNPIFDDKQDTEFTSAGLNVTYKHIFDSKNWNLNTGFYVAQGDSDIDFYDTELYMASVGLAYKF